ncbi:hypothetical protein BLNAU_22342 [Blattamonas nauphoetae]|uniref:Uncharacterized protein n=1 Tax=Blattamonas nauphoetae TaxID=2049346 RepID=A0ABQ9WTV7_9EUKA|nr:hypothetical protein BLNAU_22342 [Blattamonas nauphoetae]
MCFVMNKIAITRHPHSAQHFLLPTSLPSAEKSSVLPPITGCEEKNQHICILVDQAPLPHVFTPLSPNLAFPLPSEVRSFPLHHFSFPHCSFSVRSFHVMETSPVLSFPRDG